MVRRSKTVPPEELPHPPKSNRSFQIGDRHLGLMLGPKIKHQLCHMLYEVFTESLIASHTDPMNRFLERSRSRRLLKKSSMFIRVRNRRDIRPSRMHTGPKLRVIGQKSSPGKFGFVTMLLFVRTRALETPMSTDDLTGSFVYVGTCKTARAFTQGVASVTQWTKQLTIQFFLTLGSSIRTATLHTIMSCRWRWCSGRWLAGWVSGACPTFRRHQSIAFSFAPTHDCNHLTEQGRFRIPSVYDSYTCQSNVVGSVACRTQPIR